MIPRKDPLNRALSLHHPFLLTGLPPIFADTWYPSQQGCIQARQNPTTLSAESQRADRRAL